MATATRKSIPQSYNTGNVVLELTSDEAIALRTLLRGISGDVYHTTRQLFTSIGRALTEIKVGYLPVESIFERRTLYIGNGAPKTDLHKEATFEV